MFTTSARKFGFPRFCSYIDGVRLQYHPNINKSYEKSIRYNIRRCHLLHRSNNTRSNIHYYNY